MTRTTTAPAPAMPPPAATAPHTLTEDAVAVFTGVLLISVGVVFFTSAGLLTGGTAGLAFLLHYATPYTRMIGEQLLAEKMDRMPTGELGAAKRLLTKVRAGRIDEFI